MTEDADDAPPNKGSETVVVEALTSEVVVVADARTNELEENGSDKEPSKSTLVPMEVVGIAPFD